MTSSRARKTALRLERLLHFALNLTLYPLSRLWPRRDDHWAFGHQGELFSGNPKFLFLWMHVNRPDIRVTWITGSRATRDLLAAHGYRVRRRWSLPGVWAAARARVFVFAHSVSDVNLQLSGGALLLNLWHGVGLKATMLGDAGGVVAQHWHHRHSLLGRARYLGHVTMPDIIVTTSPFMQRHFAQQFQMPAARCPQLGYPRLDLVDDRKLAAMAKAVEPDGFDLYDGRYDQAYVYVPTYRDTGREFLAQAMPDMTRLDAALAARNAVLYVKLHPRTRGWVSGDHPRIKPWPAQADIHTYLPDIDVLITDYSSILYDYLRCRPVGAIIYAFDYDDYVANDRSLLYPFDDNVAGLRVSTFPELCDALASGAALAPDARTETISRRFWGDSGDSASARIADHVMAVLRSPSAKPRPAVAMLARQSGEK